MKRKRRRIIIFLNKLISKVMDSISRNQFSVLVTLTIRLLFAYSRCCDNPRSSRGDESALRRKRGSSRKDLTRDVALLIVVAPPSAPRLYYYIILTRTTKGTKLDLPTKLDLWRLSPFFPRIRRVSEWCQWWWC